MKTYFIIAFTILLGHMLLADSPKQEVNLRGKWRFEVGDNPEYAEVNFNDSDWEKIRVPDQWEDQGFPGYDGYAWYRTTFKISNKLQNKVLSLHLGYIDDVDKVYINGHFINGRGSDEPNYISAYNQRRVYRIPNHVLEFGGENVIAVRVFDEWGVGGIVSGRIGIYSQKSANITMDMSGNWKFHKGDNLLWAAMDLDDSEWETLIVPGFWENQGLWGMDGYGWYRTKLTLPQTMKNEKLILFIGAIDDADEVYINGEKVSSKGKFPGENFKEYNRRFYNQERFYYIPNHVIQWGKENVIAVRVWDSGGDGGIYRGPVGLTTRKEYHKFRKSHRKNYFNFSDFMDDIFD
ncbi:sugar-binding domain-containing protein [bacterium]